MTERVPTEVQKALVEVGMKQCAKCHHIKDLDEFHRHPSWTGRQPYCKICILSTMEDRLQNGGRDSEKPWKPKRIKYNSAHARVKLINGSASKHMCVDGGDHPAHDWTYIGGCPNELTEVVRGSILAYSINPEFYQPRCRKHHKLFDGKS